MRPPRTVSSSVTSARGWSYQGGRSRNPTGFPLLGRAGNRSSHAIYPASTRIRAAMQPQRPMSSPLLEQPIQARFRSRFHTNRYLAAAVMLK